MLQLPECFEHPGFQVPESTKSWVAVVMVIWVIEMLSQYTKCSWTNGACLPRPEASRNLRPRLPGMLLLDSDEAKVHNLDKFAQIRMNWKNERIKLSVYTVMYCICLLSLVWPSKRLCKMQNLGSASGAVQMFTSWSQTHRPTPWRPSEPTLECFLESIPRFLGKIPEFRALRVQARLGPCTQSQVQPQARTNAQGTSANCFNRYISNECLISSHFYTV